MLKGHWIMVYFILLQMIADCLGLVTVIGEETLMIEKVQVVLFSSQALLHLLGVQRNIQLLLFQLVKLNMLQQPLAFCHAVWLRRLLKILKFEQDIATDIFVGNKSAIALGKNPIFHDRSKHIDTKYHFIRECIGKKEIQLKHVTSKDQVADIFTKALKFEDFCRLRVVLGVVKG